MEKGKSLCPPVPWRRRAEEIDALAFEKDASSVHPLWMGV